MLSLVGGWATLITLNAYLETKVIVFPIGKPLEPNADLQTRKYWQEKWKRERELIEEYRNKESGQSRSTSEEQEH